MKNRIIIIVSIIALFILLTPIPFQLLDGGTKGYNALLYSVTKVHSLTTIEEMRTGKEYREGIIVKILGFEVFNSVN